MRPLLNLAVHDLKYGIVLFFLCLATGAFPQDHHEKYNVLFIAVDDLNTDIALYGHPLVTTPNIDRLASRGVFFERAYCQYPLCNPSRASVMTGRKPDRIKVYDLSTRFRETLPNVVTLPQLFMNNGYYTARVGKIYHYGVPGGIGTNGLDDPASWRKVVNPKGRDRTDEPQLTRLLPMSVGLGTNLAYLAAEGGDEEQTDGIVAREAVTLLKENKHRPFFIGVGFFRPHLPSVAPKKYFDLYPLDKVSVPPFAPGDLDQVPDAALFTRPANWNLSEAHRREAIRAYYASVTYMDAQLGVVLDALDSLDLTKNTVVVLWSDHGFNLGEHGQWQKRSLFEKGLRVPLVISAPNGVKGGRCTRPVQLVDLYPTLAEYCNLTTDFEQDGISLKKLADRPESAWPHAAYSQVSLGDETGLKISRSLPSYNASADTTVLPSLETMGRSVRTERWRYTEWDEGRRGVELYDEENDPEEKVNLAGKKRYRHRVKQLSKMLRRHFSD